MASKLGDLDNDKINKMLMQEMAIMKKMKHPNVLSLYEVIEDKDTESLYMVTDLMNLGYLGSKNYFEYFKIKRENIFPETLIWRHFRDCLSGLFYLHNVASVVHLDIKPENIMVDQNGVAKFGDFGISRIFNKNTEWLTQAQGTRLYHAPEAWTQKTFKAKPLDIWALGATFYELYAGESPFYQNELKKLKEKIINEE